MMGNIFEINKNSKFEQEVIDIMKEILYTLKRIEGSLKEDGKKN